LISCGIGTTPQKKFSNNWLKVLQIIPRYVILTIQTAKICTFLPQNNLKHLNFAVFYIILTKKAQNPPFGHTITCICYHFDSK